VKIRAALVVVALLPSAAGCGSSATAPASPTAPPASSSTTNLTGTWTGTGNDAQGAETFSWSLTQSGDRVSGSAILDSADRNDGSCGSCHKQKTGTLAGTLSGGTLTLTLEFPAGGGDITPLCGITMHTSTADIAAGRITAAYTGTTTCEGSITDGKLVVTR
jgi:hypothetical protein